MRTGSPKQTVEAAARVICALFVRIEKNSEGHGCAKDRAPVKKLPFHHLLDALQIIRCCRRIPLL
jgi:hypothetical protein